MHLLRIHGRLRKHRFRGHPKIALRIIGRHVPFIPKKQLHLAPRHHRLQQWVVRQQLVKCFRRGTARERDTEAVLLSDAFSRRLQELGGGRLRNAICVPEDPDFSIGRHLFRANL